MSEISDLLEMIERKAPVLMRCQLGTGARIGPAVKFSTHVVTRKPWTKCEPHEVAEWIKCYVEEKMSTYAIGERFNRDSTAIRHHLIRAGVKLRTQKEAASLR